MDKLRVPKDEFAPLGFNYQISKMAMRDLLHGRNFDVERYALSEMTRKLGCFIFDNFERLPAKLSREEIGEVVWFGLRVNLISTEEYERLKKYDRLEKIETALKAGRKEV